MEGTLRIGDHLFVDKLACSPAGAASGRIRLADKRLWLNGRPAEEPYVQHISPYKDSYRENIIGKPLIVWWSYDAPTERLDDLSDLARNFFTKTRWERTLLLTRSRPPD